MDRSIFVIRRRSGGELRSHFHQIGERFGLHFSHHLAPVCLIQDRDRKIPDSVAKSRDSANGGAKTAALDPMFAETLARWNSLPPVIKSAILVVARAHPSIGQPKHRFRGGFQANRSFKFLTNSAASILGVNKACSRSRINPIAVGDEKCSLMISRPRASGGDVECLFTI
jgi:hypothetical protein